MVPLTLAFLHRACWLLAKLCEQMDKDQKLFPSKPGTKSLKAFLLIQL